MTDKEFDENLNNITRKMTPDEALDESRRVTGLDPSLTPEQRGAASLTASEMEYLRNRAGVSAQPAAQGPAASAPAGAPAAPAAPETPAPLDHTYGTKNRKAPGSVTVSLPGEKPFEAVEGQKDVTRTQYGGKVRVVDQKTGAVSWEDLEGNAIEAPASERMRAELGANAGNIDPWKALADQQSQEDMMRSMRIAQSKVDANNAALSTRRERKMRQQLKVTDNLQQAAANMQSNLADVQAHIKSGGDISESGARRDADGNWWVEGIVAPTQINTFNSEMAELGGRDALKNIMVRQQINKTTGEPMGEPTFAAVYVKDGNVGDGIGVYTKELSMREAMRSTVKAYEDKFKDHDAAVNYAAGVFGVSDPAKYGLMLHGGGKPASVAAAEVRAKSAAEGNASKERIAQGKNEVEAMKLIQRYQELESRKDVALAKAKTEEEKNRIQKEYNDAKLALGKELRDFKIAQTAVMSGNPETRASGNKWLQENMGGNEGGDKASPKPGDNTNTQWKEGAEYVNGMKVPVGGSVTRNGKTYYMWSDGNLHARREEVK